MVRRRGFKRRTLPITLQHSALFLQRTTRNSVCSLRLCADRKSLFSSYRMKGRILKAQTLGRFMDTNGSLLLSALKAENNDNTSSIV
jgi:hypothetical protein